jgi:hypothetical protein
MMNPNATIATQMCHPESFLISETVHKPAYPLAADREQGMKNSTAFAERTERGVRLTSFQLFQRTIRRASMETEAHYEERVNAAGFSAAPIAAAALAARLVSGLPI